VKIIVLNKNKDFTNILIGKVSKDGKKEKGEV
jgi:hypothetical protein